MNGSQRTHKRAVISAISVGRIWRDKQFVFKEGNLWQSIPAKTRDAIRKIDKDWPR